jgi:D-tyrosyl-tRNA(Tyr) deacylase
MRLVVQRVSSARVEVNQNTVGAIPAGLVVFLGIARDDTQEDADYLLDKLLGLRIFPDAEGKMNRNIHDVQGSLLLISQFTLYGDCKKGRRPSFDRAAPPDRALTLYNYFLENARSGVVPVESGIFQATMQIHLVNEGPVTLLIDSMDRSKKGAAE